MPQGGVPGDLTASQTSSTNTTAPQGAVSVILKPEFHRFEGVEEVTAQTLEQNAKVAAQKSGPSSVLGRISAFFEQHPKVVLGLKVFTVAVVVAGLIAATVFTFGAAIPAVAAIGVGSGAASIAGAGALIGAAIGLTLSSFATVAIAKSTKMFELTKSNFQDVVKFLGFSLLTSAAITGFFAGAGAGIAAGGGEYGVTVATATLGTVGSMLLYGGIMTGIYNTFFSKDKSADKIDKIS